MAAQKQLFPLLLFVGVILAVVVALTAFNQNTDNRNYASTPTSGVMTYHGQLPPNAPEFPTPPGATLGQSLKKVEGVKTAFAIEMSIPSQSILAMREFYTRELTNQGWEILTNFEGSLQTTELFLQAKKGTTTVNLSLEQEKGTTIILADFPFTQ